MTPQAVSAVRDDHMLDCEDAARVALRGLANVSDDNERERIVAAAFYELLRDAREEDSSELERQLAYDEGYENGKTDAEEEAAAAAAAKSLPALEGIEQVRR